MAVTRSIFVSYSRRDGALVTPVVSLLRASRAIVFRDADSIEPGARWRDALATAIDDAQVVVVFWCEHAQGSAEVAREYEAAIAGGKDVLPLLLDDTPLPERLGQYQYIDFRDAFPAGHDNVDEDGDGRRDVRRPGPSRLPILVGAVATVALVGGGVLYATRSGDDVASPTADATDTVSAVVAVADTPVATASDGGGTGAGASEPTVTATPPESVPPVPPPSEPTPPGGGSVRPDRPFDPSVVLGERGRVAGPVTRSRDSLAPLRPGIRERLARPGSVIASTPMVAGRPGDSAARMMRRDSTTGDAAARDTAGRDDATPDTTAGAAATVDDTAMPHPPPPPPPSLDEPATQRPWWPIALALGLVAAITAWLLSRRTRTPVATPTPAAPAGSASRPASATHRAMAEALERELARRGGDAAAGG